MLESYRCEECDACSADVPPSRTPVACETCHHVVCPRSERARSGDASLRFRL